MTDRAPDDIDEKIECQLSKMTNEEILERIRIMDSEILTMGNNIKTTEFKLKSLRQRMEDNKARLKSQAKKRPLLVAEVSQIHPEGQGSVIKTSTRRSIYLENMKLVEGRDLKPGDNVCVDKDSFIVVNTLPKEIDPRVAAMEVVDRPTDSFLDVGGLDRQIQELLEAVVLPLTHPEKFAALGIPPPKGVLLYGAPGTGKTLVARACANKTQSTFLKLAGSNLVQCYIGGGAKLVRDTFQLAKMKAPTIVFIDELDAVGSRRREASERSSGAREVDRTLIELLNQMDGFSTRDQVKVIGATNRVDVLDPALLRSGRMDKKIEFPEPDEAARTRVMQIHTRKMKVGPDVDLEEIGRTTEGFNCAMCKALCTEAAMLALRRGSQSVAQADFVDAVSEVLARKKFNANHYV